MKSPPTIFTAIVLMAAATVVSAATKTTTLSIPTMDCPVCPLTVKKALTNVAGVSRVEVNFERREAIVTFDDAKTDVEALRQATADAGYPASVKP